MLSAPSLCPIPFLGHCDNSRLQMSAKQLAQALTSNKCEVPRVIGKDYRFLSDSTKLFKYTAPTGGQIVYQNDDIMLTYLEDIQNGTDSFNLLQTPQTRTCTGLYGTNLRNKRENGPFQAGDILYEYDCFKNGIPTYGYNLWTAYTSFFGFNHEDSMVFSESAAELCKSTKTETIIIPIYTYSIFKMVYNEPDDFGFIPGLGKEVKDGIVAYKAMIKAKTNQIGALKVLNLSDFTKIVHNENKFDSQPITTRIHNGKVIDIRVHSNTHAISTKKMIDKNLESILCKENEKYIKDKVQYRQPLLNFMTAPDSIKILLNNYFIRHRLDKMGYDFNELMYLVEVKIKGESSSHIGDKFANRYANKGVVSLILPDELRPEAVYSKKPIDSIVGPISVISRMNFGQVLEGLISKGIVQAEDQILNDPKCTPEVLTKISKIANILGDEEYGKLIQNLGQSIKKDPNLLSEFIESIRDLGLHFEAPGFANFELSDLRNHLHDDFGVNTTEPMLVKRETIKYLNDKMKLHMPVPHKDIILPNIFVAPIYTIKLKQESSSKSKSRDFGSYKSTNRQPSQGRNRDGIIAQGSRLGQMEFDGLLAHAAVKTMQELRTVKNDAQNLKSDLAVQIVTHGHYSLPQTNNTTSCTKMMIDSLIEFLNN